jgi:hypothetical protein
MLDLCCAKEPICYKITNRQLWGVKTCVRWMTLLFAAGCLLLLLFGRSVPLAVPGFFLFGTALADGLLVVAVIRGPAPVSAQRASLGSDQPKAFGTARREAARISSIMIMKSMSPATKVRQLASPNSPKVRVWIYGGGMLP